MPQVLAQRRCKRQFALPKLGDALPGSMPSPPDTQRGHHLLSFSECIEVELFGFGHFIDESLSGSFTTFGFGRTVFFYIPIKMPAMLSLTITWLTESHAVKTVGCFKRSELQHPIASI
jgi:hypothetical protein